MNKIITGSHPTPDSINTDAEKFARYALMLMELEPRIAFDAAAVATIGHIDDQDTHDSGHASENADMHRADDPQQLIDALDQAEESDHPADDTPSRPLRQMVFIDHRVDGIDALVSGIGADYEVEMIASDRDGIAQIVESLSGRNDMDAVHIISHGSAGSLTLGTATLDFESITGKYADDLEKLRGPLSESADLLIYGCDFGSGAEGARASQALAVLTGADVATSADITGTSESGGDWDLENRTGNVEAAPISAPEWQGALKQSDSAENEKHYLPSLTEDRTGGTPAGAVGMPVRTITNHSAFGGDNGAASEGIAITGTDTSHGSWWHSTDNGDNWKKIDAVSDNNALVLVNNLTTRVYFQPEADYNGSISEALTIRDWDQTTGSNGEYVNTKANNGTGFSSESDTLELTIKPKADISSDAHDHLTPKNKALVLDVLANDTFEDADHAITAVDGQAISSGGSVNVGNGTVTLIEEGGQPKLRFTPQQDYLGRAAFSYSVTSNNLTETADVSVAVTNSLVIDLDQSAPGTTYTTGFDRGLTSIAGLISIANLDGANLSSMKITLKDASTADELVVSNDVEGITSNYNAGTGVLTLTGEQTLEKYQYALTNVYFSTTDHNPGARTITVDVASATGSVVSNTATTKIILKDSDLDGTINAFDIDSDNDGVTDVVEVPKDTSQVIPLTTNNISSNSVPAIDYNGTSIGVTMSHEGAVSAGDSAGEVKLAFTSNNPKPHITMNFDRPVDFLITSKDGPSGAWFDNVDIINVSSPGSIIVIEDPNGELKSKPGTYSGSVSFAAKNPGQGNDGHWSVRVLSTTSVDVSANNVDPVKNEGNKATLIKFSVAGVAVEIDKDGDHRQNHLDIDSDNDGITDNVEAQTTDGYIAPNGKDVDEDGLDDAYDSDTADSSASASIGLKPTDSDKDATPDIRDQDSDDDGVADIRERGDGGLKVISSGTDSDNDGLLDIFEGEDTDDDFDANDENLTKQGFSLADTDGDTAADGSGARPLLADLDYRDPTVTTVVDLDKEASGTGYSAKYHRGMNAIIGEVAITDVDDTHLSKMRITLKDATATDELILSNNFDGITSDYNPDTGILTLQGKATLERYQALLSNVNFQTTDPKPGTRTITVEAVSATDGAISAPATTTIKISDTDRDGLVDGVDVDADNDGILDIAEYGKKPNVVEFSAGGGQSHTFMASGLAKGLMFDIYNLDNSFNVSINGSKIADADIQFYVDSTSPDDNLVRFASDGAHYGSNGINNTWQFSGRHGSPMIRLVVDRFGGISLFGTRGGTPLEELRVYNSHEYSPDNLLEWNDFEWSTSGEDTIVISQQVIGATNIKGESFGYVRSDNNDFDNDGLDNDLDIDADNDGITDNVEAQLSAGYIAPSGKDKDRDGLDDAFDFDTNSKSELRSLGLSPPDTDSDGADDFVDHDADADGSPDIAERGDGAPSALNDTMKADTDADGLLDVFEGTNNNDADVNDENLKGEIFALADDDDDVSSDGHDAVPMASDFAYRDNPDVELPVVDLDREKTGVDYSGSYYETPVSIGNTIDVSVSGAELLTSATIQIDNPKPSEVLEIKGNLPWGMTSSYDSDTGILTIKGRTTAYYYSLALNQVRLSSSFPDDKPRNMNVKVTTENGLTSRNAVATITLADFDNDQVADKNDIDDDDDGILDVDEGSKDRDNDGLTDGNDIDSDNDGITDNVEAQATGDYIAPSGKDVDKDGLDDAYDSDTGDKSATGSVGLTPLDNDSDNTPDFLDQDSDGDGEKDISERGDGGPKKITSTADSDNDGLLDIFDGTDADEDFDANDENLTGKAFNLGDKDSDVAVTPPDSAPTASGLDYRDSVTNPIIDPDADDSSGKEKLGYITKFVENGSAVAIVDTDVTIKGFGEAITGATVTLSNGQTGDQLLVDGSDADSGTFDSGISWTRTDTGITLSGDRDEADYQTALKLITFKNTEAKPATGMRKLSVTVDSDGASSAPATIQIAVGPVNDAPKAKDDSGEATEDTPLKVTAENGLLANDQDVDGNTLTITGFNWDGNDYTAGDTAEIAGVGTLTIAKDGSYNFTPAANYNGSVPDVSYTVSDGTVTDTGTVNLSVTEVNDAPETTDDSGEATEDTPLKVTAKNGLLANDQDADGNTLTITGFNWDGNDYTAGETAESAGVGTLTIAKDGAYSFTPAANYNGSVPEVSYTVSDGTVTDTGTVNLSVGPVNDAPKAKDDSGEATEDTPLKVTAKNGLLANDQDVDGNTLTITGFNWDGNDYTAGDTAEIAGVGTLTIAKDGSYNFTPAANYNGSVPEVSYTVSDGTSTDTGTLRVALEPVDKAPAVKEGSDKTTGAEKPKAAPVQDVDSDTVQPTPKVTDDGSKPEVKIAEKTEVKADVKTTEDSKPEIVSRNKDVPGVPHESSTVADPVIVRNLSARGEVLNAIEGTDSTTIAEGVVEDAVSGIAKLNSASDIAVKGIVVNAVTKISGWESSNETEISGPEKNTSDISTVSETDTSFLIDAFIRHDQLYVMMTGSDSSAGDIRVTLADGRVLPGWLILTRKGLLVGKPPAGLPTIDLLVQTNVDGTIHREKVRINLTTGTVEAHTAEGQSSPNNNLSLSEALLSPEVEKHAKTGDSAEVR